jgi:hypothetical protein
MAVVLLFDLYTIYQQGETQGKPETQVAPELRILIG